ncbi:MAG: hypothetical protein EA398_00580, partial [Deltaproteobacteria bacterium]
SMTLFSGMTGVGFVPPPDDEDEQERRRRELLMATPDNPDPRAALVGSGEPPPSVPEPDDWQQRFRVATPDAPDPRASLVGSEATVFNRIHAAGERVHHRFQDLNEDFPRTEGAPRGPTASSGAFVRSDGPFQGGYGATPPPTPQERRERINAERRVPEPDDEEAVQAQIEETRAARAEATPGEYVRHGLSGVGRSLAELPASALGGVAVMQTHQVRQGVQGLQELADRLDAQLPEWIQRMGEREARDHAAMRMANAIREQAERIPGASDNPAVQDSFIWGQVMPVLGSFGGYAGLGALLGPAGPTTAALGATAAATLGGMDRIYNEATGQFGVPEDQALRSAVTLGAAGGAVQVFGPVSFLRRMGRIRGAGGGQGVVATGARAGALGATEEAGAEGFGQVLFNVAAMNYDEDRQLFDDFLQSAALGSVGGGVFGAVGGGVAAARARQEAETLREMIDSGVDTDGTPLTPGAVDMMTDMAERTDQVLSMIQTDAGELGQIEPQVFWQDGRTEVSAPELDIVAPGDPRIEGPRDGAEVPTERGAIPPPDPYSWAYGEDVVVPEPTGEVFSQSVGQPPGRPLGRSMDDPVGAAVRVPEPDVAYMDPFATEGDPGMGAATEDLWVGDDPRPEGISVTAGAMPADGSEPGFVELGLVYDPETGLPEPTAPIADLPADAATSPEIVEAEEAPGELIPWEQGRARFPLRVEPSRDDAWDVAEATYDYPTLVGTGFMRVADLSGGVRDGDATEASRVSELVAAMQGDDGFFEALVVDATGEVLEGQHRLEAARQMGLETLPVEVVDDLVGGLPLEQMEEAARNAGVRQPQHVRNVIQNVTEAVREAGSPEAAAQEYEWPAGFEAAHEAVLDAMASPPVQADAAPSPEIVEAEAAPGTPSPEGSSELAPLVEAVRNQYGLADPRSDDVGKAPLSRIRLDPERFQYKAVTDPEAGVTDQFRNVEKWNPDIAGVISLWHDPADGELYVINGHHRVEMARRFGVENLDVRVVQAPDESAARLVGAMTNIAEDKGTEIDAAKLFREAGVTLEDLAQYGISVDGAMARKGMALSRLEPWIFNRVVQEQLPINRAVVIGEANLRPHEQTDLMQVLDRMESRGRRLTNRQLDHFIQQARTSPAYQGERGTRGSDGMGQQQSLFGDEVLTTDLYEQAVLADYVSNEINAKRRILGRVASEREASRIAEEGAGDIDTDAARAGRVNAEQMQELWERLSTRSGTVSDILRAHAARMAEGEGQNEVKRSLWSEVEGHLAEEIARFSRGEAVGTDVPGELDQVGQPAEGPVQVEREAGAPAEGLAVQDDVFGAPPQVVEGSEQAGMFGERDFAPDDMATMERRAQQTVERLGPLLQADRATEAQRAQYRDALRLLRRSEAMGEGEVQASDQASTPMDPMVGDLFADAPAEAEAAPAELSDRNRRSLQSMASGIERYASAREDMRNVGAYGEDRVQLELDRNFREGLESSQERVRSTLETMSPEARASTERFLRDNYPEDLLAPVLGQADAEATPTSPLADAPPFGDAGHTEAVADARIIVEAMEDADPADLTAGEQAMLDDARRLLEEDARARAEYDAQDKGLWKRELRKRYGTFENLREFQRDVFSTEYESLIEVAIPGVATTRDMIERVKRGEEVANVWVKAKGHRLHDQGLGLPTRTEDGRVVLDRAKTFELMRMFRHPKAEFAHLVAYRMEGGRAEVVDHMITTVGSPTEVGMTTDQVTEFFERASEAGAAVMSAHNHPMGEARPSNTDQRNTMEMSKIARVHGVEYAGELVMNSDVAAWITATARPDGSRVWDVNTDLVTREINLSDPGADWTRRGPGISTTQEAAEVFGALPKSDNRVDFLFVDEMGNSMSLHSVPVNEAAAYIADGLQADTDAMGANSVVVGVHGDYGRSAVERELADPNRDTWAVGGRKFDHPVVSGAVDTSDTASPFNRFDVRAISDRWRRTTMDEGDLAGFEGEEVSDGPRSTMLYRQAPVGDESAPTPQGPPRAGPPPVETDRQAMDRLRHNRSVVEVVREHMDKQGKRVPIGDAIEAGEASTETRTREVFTENDVARLDAMMEDTFTPLRVRQMIRAAKKATTALKAKRALERAEKIMLDEQRRHAIQDLQKAYRMASRQNTTRAEKKRLAQVVQSLESSDVSDMQMEHLRDISRVLQRNPESSVLFPADIYAQMAKLDKAKLRTMDPDDLAAVTDALKHWVETVRDNKRMLGSMRHEFREEVVPRAVAEAVASKQPLPLRKTFFGEELKPKRGLVSQFMNEFSVRPEVLLENLGETFRKYVWENVTIQGQKQYLARKQFYEDTFYGAVEQVLGIKMNEGTWSEQQAARRQLESWRRQVFTVEADGQTYQFNRDEVIHLILTMSDPSNAALIERNGLVMERNNKEVEIEATDELIRAVNDLAGPAERQLADFMFEQFNTRMKDDLNDAWEQNYGYSIANVPYYVPRNVDMTFADTSADPLKAMAMMQQATLTSWGHLRDRSSTHGARLKVGSAFEMYSHHMDHVSRISGYLTHYRNARVIMGHPDVKRTLIERIGEVGYDRL